MGKEVAKQDKMPSYLAKMKPSDVNNDDNFDSTDVVVPRIKLLQALSEEVEIHDTAKQGRFWHTGMDLDLGAELEFVICARRKKYLLSAPMEDGQGILARCDDAREWDRTGKWQVKLKGRKQPVEWEITDTNLEKSGLALWGSSDPEDPDSGPAATLFYDYLVLLPNMLDLGPAVMTLARSQIRKAKKGLNDKIQLHASAGRPMQALKFKVSAVDDKNPDGQSYKNVQFTSAGFVDEQLFDTACSLKDMLSTAAIQDEIGDLKEPKAPDADSDEF